MIYVYVGLMLAAATLVLIAVADVIRQVVLKGAQRDIREYFDGDDPTVWN